MRHAVLHAKVQAQPCAPAGPSPTMPIAHDMVRPHGLHPVEAAKAHHLHAEEGLSLDSVRDKVRNMEGNKPSKKGVWAAVQRVKALEGSGVPQGNYKNCGRKRALTAEEEASVVDFVKQWRGKRFCTCKYIVQSMKLRVGRKTVSRVLNRHGYFWRPVPKIRGLSATELEKRKAFVEEHLHRTASWWEENMNLVIDGVTLTMAPKPLGPRQRHMAQSIKHTWMLQGETQSPDLHTFNRYGVQLGVKVPLWGGFTGRGHFTLREWTPRPKMTKLEWAQRVPALKRAVDRARGASPQGPGQSVARQRAVPHAAASIPQGRPRPRELPAELRGFEPHRDGVGATPEGSREA